MNKATKIWLVAAASLVLIGCILFAGVMTSLRWDFAKLSTAKYQTNSYEITDAFNSISMKTDTIDILFVLSDDGTCRVECYEEERAAHSVAVKDGTLAIELIDDRSVSDYIGYIGINIGSPKMTVYLPETEYISLTIHDDTGDIEIPNDFKFKNVDISLSTGDVDFCASASEWIKIKTSTGDICVENISAGALELSVSTGMVTALGVRCEDNVTVGVSTGDAYLTDITCSNLTSSGNTGDLFMKNVVAAEGFSIKRTTGDVEFDGCDAAEIFVETDTGAVYGTLLSDKVFFIQTDTGDIEVPATTTGGRCEISTNTGDVEIEIKR